MTERNAAAVEFRVAARLENLAVLRTVVGAVGMFSDLNLVAGAVLGITVDEACTGLIRSATPGATLMVVVDPRADAVVVEASTTCAVDDVLTQDSLSWHVLSALTDGVRTFRNGNSTDRVFGITLTTRRAGSSR